MKFKNLLAIAAIFSISQIAFAASSEDFGPSNPACTIMVNDTTASRFINVNYIRLVKVDKNQPILFISMASNYDNYKNTYFSITYKNYQDALKAMENLSDNINNCQYNAAMKRAAKKKQ